MELGELQGKKRLSGIDRETVAVKEYEWQDNTQDVERVVFILDEIKYCAQENPSDGYRSYMDDLTMFDGEVKNTFNPVDVFIIHRVGNSGRKDNILEIRNIDTGNIILEVGTENTEDYYPYFVCNFSAENIGEQK